MADDDPSFFTNEVSVILIAMGSAALVVTMYHLIAVCLCNHQFRRRNPDQQQPPPTPPRRNILLTGASQASSINETSLARLIPAHKYKKKVDGGDVASGDRDGGAGDPDNATCAVCLGDFEDGEELRTLPECAHSFHVPCIDAWLYSHPNCPVCRADATPSPAVLSFATDFDPGESNVNGAGADHRIQIVQTLVHSDTVQR